MMRTRTRFLTLAILALGFSPARAQWRMVPSRGSCPGGQCQGMPSYGVPSYYTTPSYPPAPPYYIPTAYRTVPWRVPVATTRAVPRAVTPSPSSPPPLYLNNNLGPRSVTPLVWYQTYPVPRGSR